MSADGHVNRILRERAVHLARPTGSSTPQGALLELLEFRLASERYAVETRYVSEVHPLRDLTPLPGTPPFVRGIVNLRGRILPVYDLKSSSRCPSKALPTCIASWS